MLCEFCSDGSKSVGCTCYRMEYYTANKPFLAYEQLKLVFRKDRATGNLAESATDVLESMNAENKDDFEIEHNVTPAPSPSNTTSRSPVPNEGEATSKKRKRSPGLSKMFEVTTNKIVKQQIK